MGYCVGCCIAGNPIMDYAKHIVLGYYNEISITDGNNGVRL